MWELVIITVLVIISLLYAQKKHYEHLEKELEQQCVQECVDKLSDEVEERLKDYTDYKKRVDTLTLKSGFKL